MQKRLLLLLLFIPSLALAAPEVPTEFLGDWVPQSATCQSPLKFQVEAKRVLLINGSQSKIFGNIDVCYTCEGGAQYSGNVVWLLPEFGRKSNSSFTANFNAEEKLGVVKLAIENLDLKKQFPLHQVALKHCANTVRRNN